ncbi:MAG TPA: MFS transporter [Abditibacteriaceae bacterium]
MSSTSSSISNTDFSNLTPEQEKANAAATRVIFLTVFLDLLGFGIVIPQLGVYASEFGASEIIVGILASTYSAMGFLFTPFWGRLSDRIGRRPVLLYSIFGTAIGYVLFAFAHTLPLMFAARIVDGITGGNISVAQAYLSDVTPPEKRSKTFGMLGAAFGVGFAIGPAIGAGLAHLPGIWGGNFGVGMFTAALAFLNWFLAWKRLPETLPQHVREANAQDKKRVQIFNTSAFVRAFKLRGVGLIIAITFFVTVAFATLQGTYSLFLITRYTRPQVQTFIASQPREAITEAQKALGEKHVSAAAVESAGSDGIVKDASGDVAPYPRSMGGDFAASEKLPPTPEGLSWRHIEKLLVRPRAAQLTALVFASIGIVALLVQGGLIGPLKKKFGETNLVVAGALLMALGLALVPIPREHMRWEFGVMALLAFGNSIATPVLTALVSELAPERERGEMMGVFQSVASLGRIVGPNVGGFFFAISSGAPYWAGAAIMMIAFAISLRLRGVCPDCDSREAKPALATE